MKNIPFYPTIWQPVPYSVYSSGQVKFEELKPKKNLVFANKDLLVKGISEMTLSIVEFSLIDKEDRVHLISSFDKQTLNLKGMYAGLQLNTNEALKLSTGQYTAIRLHLDSHGLNNFTCSDRSTGTLNYLDYLDFNIEGGLSIKDGDSYELRLNFNFLPYTLSSYFNPIRDFFKRQRQFSTKLTRSFGS